MCEPVKTLPLMCLSVAGECGILVRYMRCSDNIEVGKSRLNEIPVMTTLTLSSIVYHEVPSVRFVLVVLSLSFLTL